MGIYKQEPRPSSDESLTFTVITEAHLGLAETNGVLSFANAIELLQLRLVDALHSILVRGGNSHA